MYETNAQEKKFHGKQDSAIYSVLCNGGFNGETQQSMCYNLNWIKWNSPEFNYRWLNYSSLFRSISFTSWYDIIHCSWFIWIFVCYLRMKRERERGGEVKKHVPNDFDHHIDIATSMHLDSNCHYLNPQGNQSKFLLSMYILRVNLTDTNEKLMINAKIV